jgi:hypothetical protein
MGRGEDGHMETANSLKGHIDVSDALVSVEEALQELHAAVRRLERRAGTKDCRRPNEFPRFQRYDRPGRRVA